MTRLYSTGLRWAIWRWTFPPSHHIIRLHLLKTPWFSIYLHWITAADPQPDPHDHPVSFLSLVLWGEYAHRVSSGGVVGLLQKFDVEIVSSYKLFHRNTIHRIVAVSKPYVLTLCLAWHPKGSTLWGFYTKQGWIPWKSYTRGAGADNKLR